MHTKPRFLGLFIATALLALPTSATMLFLSLDNEDLISFPNSSITFSGVLENDTGSDVFLNGASADLPYTELTFDPTPFFTFAPLVLADGNSYAGELFSIAISAVAIPGDYLGSFFIQGGPDESTFDIVASADFQVVIAPEPNAAQLILMGCCLFAVRGSRRVVHKWSVHCIGRKLD